MNDLMVTMHAFNFYVFILCEFYMATRMVARVMMNVGVSRHEGLVVEYFISCQCYEHMRRNQTHKAPSCVFDWISGMIFIKGLSELPC